MGLGILVDGRWVSEREQEDNQGRFVRPATTFRDRVTFDGSSGYSAEAGRYLYTFHWLVPGHIKH